MGQGVKKNSKRAFYWTSKAAKKNDPLAQWNLALSYLDGDGVKQDEKKAKFWFRKAAKNGHKKAKVKLKSL